MSTWQHRAIVRSTIRKDTRPRLIRASRYQQIVTTDEMRRVVANFIAPPEEDQ